MYEGVSVEKMWLKDVQREVQMSMFMRKFSVVVLVAWSVSIWELCACVPTPFTEKRDTLENFQGMYACANTTMMSEPQSIDDVRNAVLSFSKVRGYGTTRKTHTLTVFQWKEKAAIHVMCVTISSCPVENSLRL